VARTLTKKACRGACGFKDANIVIERGEKVAFVGKKWRRKSTMIKAIMKDEVLRRS
jgi:ABC-type multidrug transport system fused ATPase/permease subunit